MSRSLRRTAVALIALVAGNALLQNPAQAQFGMYQLPKDDFVWNWGRAAGEAGRTGFEDINVWGNESGFRCQLTAKSGFSGRMSPSD
ncbi:MAG: hypothetical protein ABW220_12655, partial [Burkholderiaceae bacterium]